jgi:hypothetical protein
MLPEMYEKDADIPAITGKALADEGLLSELLDGLKEKNETLRYNCHKVLIQISEGHGEVLYPHLDYFVEQLDSSNTYHKLSAAQLLARLCRVDNEGRFESIFDKYIGLLSDKGTVLAAYIALNTGRIAAAKPHLREKIAGILLDFDRIYQGKQPEMTKAYVIEAFDMFYAEAENKGKIKEFISGMLDSSSSRTRKAAKTFLNKWG